MGFNEDWYEYQRAHNEKILDEECRRYEQEQIESERWLEQYNSAEADRQAREAREEKERREREEYKSWRAMTADETWKERAKWIEREKELQNQLKNQEAKIRADLGFLEGYSKKERRIKIIIAIVIFIVVLVLLRITDKWFVIESILDIIYELLKELLNAIKGIIDFFWGFIKK